MGKAELYCSRWSASEAASLQAQRWRRTAHTTPTLPLPLEWCSAESMSPIAYFRGWNLAVPVDPMPGLPCFTGL